MNRLVLVAAVVAGSAQPARADRLAVSVVEIAGANAYLSPGRAAGLGPGSHVELHGRDFVVIGATEKFAVIDRAGSPLAIGEAGIANATPSRLDRDEKLPAPKPLEAFRDQWPTAELPAATQHVAAVALGAGAAAGRSRLTITSTLSGGLDSAGTNGELETRAIGSFALSSQQPLGADVDAAFRLFGDGWNAHERTPLFVNAAQLRWGDPADPNVLVGRLRYAATSLGMLDGGRAMLHVGDLELAAFGGVLPDPVSGHPDTDASEFGAELVWDRARSAWQPRVALTAHGTTWDGAIDERVVSVAASAHHDAVLLDAWADAQMFSADNPWNAPTIDLTGAGATAEWRHLGSHLGIDLTFLRPQRSLRLAAALPADWLCARAPQPGNIAESCLGEDYWLAATASAGKSGHGWSVDAVGSIGETRGVASGYDTSGYVRAELGPRVVRFVLAPAGGHDNFGAWVATDIGVATAPSRQLDLAVTYRPERLDYVAAAGATFVQALVTELHWSVTPSFDVAVSAVGSIGGDLNVLDLITTLAWRPLR